MTTTLIIIALIFTVLSLGVAFLPLALAQKGNKRVERQTQEINRLEEQLDRFVNAVRDLDFDYDMGKLSAEDYATQRKFAIGRGVSVWLRLQASQSVVQRSDEELEAAIAAYRKTHPKAR